MAVGIFRKVLDKVGGLLKFIKDHLGDVSKIAVAAAPVLTAVNPALGAGAATVAAGAAGLDGLLNGFASPPQGSNLAAEFSNDVSPYIKFKRNI